MKKILVFSIVFILLIGIVSSSALSTLWKQGVSAANPQAARVISMADQIMEIKTIAQCATGVVASACMQSIAEQKAMGQVYGEAIKAAGPEVQKIISTYQQLDLYREAGAELVDLKIDEEGKIESGTIKPSEKDIKIGKNGLYHWSSNKPRMHQAVQQYFADRNDDGDSSSDRALCFLRNSVSSSSHLVA